jgi:hypothetical protein
MHGTAVDVGAAGATGVGIVSIGMGIGTERSVPARTRPPSLVAIYDIARPSAIKRPAGCFGGGKGDAATFNLELNRWAVDILKIAELPRSNF